jgi:hypothetical protein
LWGRGGSKRHEENNWCGMLVSFEWTLRCRPQLWGAADILLLQGGGTAIRHDCMLQAGALTRLPCCATKGPEHFVLDCPVYEDVRAACAALPVPVLDGFDNPDCMAVTFSHSAQSSLAPHCTKGGFVGPAC